MDTTATAVAMPLTLGRQIAEARKRVGLNQTQLGARWGVNLSTIGRIERDQAEPDFRQIADLASLSGWPITLFANAAQPYEDGPDDGPGATADLPDATILCFSRGQLALAGDHGAADEIRAA